VASPLENLSGPGGPLQKEAPDAKEFAGLRRSALARLTDSAKSSNSLESRFDLAYNAAHALCLAALRWHGYRPTNRYIVFQTLLHTLGLGPEVWRVWINVIPFATSENMKAILMWMSALWQI
jgi:hypothetical protein